MTTRVTADPAGTNNGLFYLFSDHLGSNSVVATSTGSQVPGSKTTYYPFGSPRTTPTQTITGRNFTGQKENLELGLIYYNARFYLPTIARFLTPDTLIPNPQSPQSFNRYTYTLNNPLRFTDPTGHNPAWCADERDNPACKPLVDFTGVKQWSFDEKLVIMHGATRIDFMLMLHGSSFLKVFGGTVTWTKTGTYAPEGNLGLRENQNSILVYEHDSATVISEGVRWVGHELGHAFDSALYPNTTDNLDYGQGTIDLATSDIRYTKIVNGLEQEIRIAGGCGIHNYLTSCYVRRSGESFGYVDEFNTTITPTEDFADMFSGYIFGFADNAAGQTRYDWMDSYMSAWIALAITNNNQ